jgi:BlaI family penicillinase repressor
MAGTTNRKHQLAPLQLEIMQVLWDREEATVAEVHQDLPKGRSLAYTTVSTMLTKMQHNGQVRIKRREAGRVLVYAAAIRE